MSSEIFSCSYYETSDEVVLRIQNLQNEDILLEEPDSGLLLTIVYQDASGEMFKQSSVDINDMHYKSLRLLRAFNPASSSRRGNFKTFQIPRVKGEGWRISGVRVWLKYVRVSELSTVHSEADISSVLTSNAIVLTPKEVQPTNQQDNPKPNKDKQIKQDGKGE